MTASIPALKVAPTRRTAAAHGKPSAKRSLALPFEIQIDSIRKGRFDDVRDAIASARIAKRGQPLASVVVADAVTGRMVIEVEV